MSRLTGNEVANLMEAYSAVYAPQQEEIVENVEQLDEADYSAANVRASQQAAARAAQEKAQKDKQLQTTRRAQDVAAYQNRLGTPATAKDTPGGERELGTKAKLNNKDVYWAGKNYGWQQLKPTGSSTLQSLNSTGTRNRFIQDPGANRAGSGDGGGSGGGGSSNLPASTKTTPAASSTVLAKQGGVEGKLNKATGKFTAGAFTGAERDRYVARGGSAAPAPAAKPSSYNPLMDKTFGYQKGAAPDQVRGSAAFNKPEIKTPQPAKPLSTSAGFGAGSPMKFGATSTQAIAAAPSTSAAASGSVAPATAKLAAAPKPVPMSPREKALNQSYEYDAYDLVLEYLLANGHVDSVDEAHYVMLEMGSETIRNIVFEQSNTLITPQQKRADELRYGAQRTTPVPPARPSGSKVKPGSRMPL